MSDTAAGAVANTVPPDSYAATVSKRLVAPVLAYLDDVYGPEATDRILLTVGRDRLFFEDANGFMPIETTEQIFKAAIAVTGDADFPYHLGRNTLKYGNKMQMLFGAIFASPPLLFENAERIERALVKTTRVKSEKLGENRYRLTISFAGDYHEPASACRNRHGTYEAVTTLFGLPFAKVDHPRCFFRGDPNCVYEVTLPENSFHFARRLLPVSAGVGIVGFAAALVAGAYGMGAAAAALTTASLGGYLLLLSQHVKKSRHWGRQANQALEAQNVQMEQENARTMFLHSLTAQLAPLVRVEDVCSTVVRSIISTYSYDSCLLWLVDENDTMRCMAAEGFSEQHQARIMDITYSVSEGLKYPDSFITRILAHRETLLLNDVASAVASFTSRTREFIEFLGIDALIIVPLYDKDKPVGMLVGAHQGRGSVSYLDKMLFESTAPVVSNSLTKALLYASMELRIRKRGELIAQRQKELLAAREMAIQSEMLSAMGKIAAGVAHEINNPLNFLVNIMPDLSRDTEGLQRILTLGRTRLPDPAARARLEGLLESAQLTEHLSDNAFVYASIDRALNRARKIAGSLKVFARTSGQDQKSEESLREVIMSVVDLIPGKYRTNVAIANTIDPQHRLMVNRIEMVQVFLALIRNALEAIGDSGSITIAAREQERGFETVIEDNGCGIAPEHAQAVFRPFFTTKDRNEHSGMGLTVVEEILKKSSGTIKLQPAAAGGTQAIVFIPRAEKQPAQGHDDEI